MASLIQASRATPPDSGGQEDASATKQRFCLKWNNYQSNVTTTFKELLAVEDFVDITLSAEGGALRAHKVVLSACSPYFRDILKGISAWQHPVIVLKDVPFEDLQGIVEFIYHGEVSVDKECLDSFLKTAQMLRVKGLTDETSTTTTSAIKSNGGRVHSRKSSKPKRSLFASNPAEALAPVAKRDKLEEMMKAENHSGNEEEIDDVEEEEINDEEEMEDEEEEEMSPMQIPNPFLGLSPQSITNAALALAAKANAANNSSTNNSTELDHEERKRQQLLLGGDLMDSSELFASSFGYPPPLKNMLHLNGSNLAASVAGSSVSNTSQDHIQISQASSSSSSTAGSLSQKKTCPYCYQQLSWHALSRHIRDMHKAKSNFVTCKFCQKMFRNKNSLGCHMWRFHKEAKDKQDNKDMMDKIHDQEPQQTPMAAPLLAENEAENP